MAISPTTQMMMEAPEGQDADQAFEEGFSSMAQRMLSNKFPELLENVVTFRILTSDVDTGSAVGFFVLTIDSSTAFIPVILANNQIKPIEMLYYKDKDIFLPLTPEWLDEISRTSVAELGEGVEPPKMLNPDADITKFVVPPATGRYSYASGGKRLSLAQFLAVAPNRIKTAFVTILRRNRRILKYAFENLDGDALTEALHLHQVKTASALPQVDILTPEFSEDQFRNVFGEKTAAAWEEAVKTGYVAADNRQLVNRAIEIESPLKTWTPEEPGFYQLRLRTGGTQLALVIPNPQPLESPLRGGKRTDLAVNQDEYWKTHKKKRSDELSEEPSHNQNSELYLVFTDDGQITEISEPPIGEVVPAETVVDSNSWAKKIWSGEDASAPTSTGIFVCTTGGKFRATRVFSVLKASTGSDGIRRIQTSDKTLVTDPKSPIAAIVAPKDSNVTYIPHSYRFLKGSHEFGPNKFLTSADDILANHVTRLEKVGAALVKIVDDAGMFSIEGQPSQTKLATLHTLVIDFGLRMKEAASLLEKAATKGHHRFYLVNPVQMVKFALLTKEAQGGPMPPAQETAPPAEGAVSPEQQGQQGMMAPDQQGMMAPPMMPPEMMAPPPPDPVQMAVTEISSQLAQESAGRAEQIAEEQRDLANQLSILEAVQQRAMEIATETGMPMMGEETAMGGAMPGAMPGTPGAMGSEAMPGEAMPGGAMPGGAMSGGAMPGEAMPGGAGVPVEETQSMELANQAEPMMENATMDPEMFEATAIGSLATEADLQSTVAEYVPTLEEALDNTGRLLLTLWIKENQLRDEVGESDFLDLEKRLRSVFDNLGALILRINQVAIPSGEMQDVEPT